MGFLENIKHTYSNPKVLVMLILGFSSGMPMLMVFSTFSTWLKEAGFSYTTIGFASWIGLLYAIKYIWSPFIDSLRIPLLGLLGRRRSWIILSQLGIFVSIFGMAFNDPQDSVEYTVLFAICLAFFSATQDIVIDAFRIDIGTPNEQGAMSSLYVYGYRLAMLVSGAGILYLSDTGSNIYSYSAWKNAYLIMILIMLPCVITVLFLTEPDNDHRNL